MRTKIITVMAMAISFSAMAQDIKSSVQTELVKIAVQSDMRENVLATNRLIQLGEPAVGALSEALVSPQVDLRAKWAVAQALGEIGGKSALPALTNCLNSDNSWLKSICVKSTAIINGEQKRAGKVYLYTIGVETTRTDVEAGTTVVIPRN